MTAGFDSVDVTTMKKTSPQQRLSSRRSTTSRNSSRSLRSRSSKSGSDFSFSGSSDDDTSTNYSDLDEQLKEEEAKLWVDQSILKIAASHSKKNKSSSKDDQDDDNDIGDDDDDDDDDGVNFGTSAVGPRRTSTFSTRSGLSASSLSNNSSFHDSSSSFNDSTSCSKSSSGSNDEEEENNSPSSRRSGRLSNRRSVTKKRQETAVRARKTIVRAESVAKIVTKTGRSNRASVESPREKRSGTKSRSSTASGSARHRRESSHRTSGGTTKKRDGKEQAKVDAVVDSDRNDEDRGKKKTGTDQNKDKDKTNRNHSTNKNHDKSDHNDTSHGDDGDEDNSNGDDDENKSRPSNVNTSAATNRRGSIGTSSRRSQTKVTRIIKCRSMRKIASPSKSSSPSVKTSSMRILRQQSMIISTVKSPGIRSKLLTGGNGIGLVRSQSCDIDGIVLDDSVVADRGSEKSSKPKKGTESIVDQENRKEDDETDYNYETTNETDKEDKELSRGAKSNVATVARRMSIQSSSSKHTPGRRMSMTSSSHVTVRRVSISSSIHSQQQSSSHVVKMVPVRRLSMTPSSLSTHRGGSGSGNGGGGGGSDATTSASVPVVSDHPDSLTDTSDKSGSSTSKHRAFRLQRATKSLLDDIGHNDDRENDGGNDQKILNVANGGSRLRRSGSGSKGKLTSRSESTSAVETTSSTNKTMTRKRSFKKDKGFRSRSDFNTTDNNNNCSHDDDIDRDKAEPSETIRHVKELVRRNSIGTSAASTHNGAATSTTPSATRGGGILRRSNSSKALLKDSIKRTFIEIIDLNPSHGVIWSNETTKVLLQLMKQYPQLCSTPYTKFRAFPDEPILPIHILCALGAPIPIVRQCLKSYPNALNDNNTSKLGTPFHFVCMFHHFHYHNRDNYDDNNDYGTDGNIIGNGDDLNGGSNGMIPQTVSNNTLMLLKYLVKTRASGLMVQNQNEQTPLHLACMAHHHEIAQLSRHSSKALQRPMSSSREADDSTSHAQDDSEIGADTTESAADGDEVVDSSIRRRKEEQYAEIVNYILQVCPKLSTVVDNDKNSPLHVACATFQNPQAITSAIVKRLLISSSSLPVGIVGGGGSAGAMISCETSKMLCISQNRYGATPIHLALYNKAPRSLLEALIQCNPKSLRIEDNKKRIPIHIAVAVKNQDCKLYELLIKHHPKSIRHRNKRDETPFQLAASKNLSTELLLLLQDTTNNHKYNKNKSAADTDDDEEPGDDEIDDSSIDPIDG